MSLVSIVIVAHSMDVARGTAATVRHMVGPEVSCAYCAGNAGGGMGTDAGRILNAIESVQSEAGVAVFVDLGGAEMNSEMAIDMLDAARAGRVRVCDAPLLEGAVIAASEAAGGADLDTVCRAAEELMK